ncbi:MAG: metallophosphoesterase [Cyanobacteriota bacterium]|nr:metallophosphoesterase [Cyanobacteriota bacterium]
MLNGRSIKFAHLSDIHLMPPTGCRCWWMSEAPATQLRQAIAELQGIPDLDFVVFTGDLVDQADPASFEQFQEIVSQLSVPYYLSVGNHDIDTLRRRQRFDRSEFVQWCRQQFAFDLAPTGYVDYSLSPSPGLRLIALDASIGTFPDPQGLLRPGQLQWLAEQLTTYAHQWILLLIHQPPLAPLLYRKYRVLPDIALSLRRLLESHGGVAAVLSGHLHVPKVTLHHHIPYLVAPALIGPVSAFRVIELALASGGDYGWLRYHWHPVQALSASPQPLWHGLVMGKPWDRRGEKRIRIPAAWTSPLPLISLP